MRIRRPNLAEVLAVLALVVASSGTAVAASRYLITSPSQIKPSVLRQIARVTRGETAEPTSPWAFSKPGIPIDGATATCPPGYEDVTGGYFADLPAGWQIASQRRTPTGYSVVAFSSEQHPIRQAKMQVTAYCRAKP
jgi:hypothetical protein